MVESTGFGEMTYMMPHVWISYHPLVVGVILKCKQVLLQLNHKLSPLVVTIIWSGQRQYQRFRWMQESFGKYTDAVKA